MYIGVAQSIPANRCTECTVTDIPIPVSLPSIPIRFDRKTMEPTESHRDMDSNTTSIVMEDKSNDTTHNDWTSSAIVPTREEDDNSDIVVNMFDVLLGRGKGMDSQYGNQRFQRKHAIHSPFLYCTTNAQRITSPVILVVVVYGFLK
jgi:hypothetical protein